jgi:serine/threonine protein kinase
MADFPEIPGYKIVREAGRGAVAVIYLAIQEKLKRKVAIKVMEKPLLQKDEKVFVRFLREAEISASLSHSNIIQIFDIGKKDQFYYIVMEYLEESLQERMNREPERKIPPEIALEIVDDIMGALDYVHLHGIYHRDIKPANIMFRKDNTPVLVDFGIARVLDQLITADMTILGTTYYMSPEQCKGDEIDGRSDVYSLGVVLFEMLTGDRPYKGKSPVIVIPQHLNSPIPGLPKALSLYQPLIDKMMAKDIEERMSSGPEFAQLRKDILEGPNNSDIPAGETYPGSIKMSPYKETAPVDFLFKKMANHLKSFIQNFLKLFKEKVVPGLTATWDKLDLFKTDEGKKPDAFFKKKFKSLDKIITDKPIIKRLILVGIPGAAALLLISILIFSPGSKSSANQSGINFSIFSEVFKQAPEYYEKLDQAHKLYRYGDLISLNEAKDLIDELKKTAIIPELEELENKITRRINFFNKAFTKYLELTLEHYRQKDFQKARDYILEAKKIKSSDKDVLQLEKLIKDSIEKKRPIKLPKKFEY